MKAPRTNEKAPCRRFKKSQSFYRPKRKTRTAAHYERVAAACVYGKPK